MTTDEAIKMFGDYHAFLKMDGSIDPSWEKVMLGSFYLPAWIELSGHPGARVTKVTCHHLLVPHFGAAFLQIYKDGNWPLLQDYGGCYNFRFQRRSNTPSLHSWGIAIDLNVEQNPFMSPPKMPLEIVNVFRGHGFKWGGDFVHRPDGMHFEWGGGKP